MKAVRDMVIVKPVYEDKTSETSLIYVPDEAKKRESNFHGVVVSVGPDNTDDLKPGDKILFRRNEGVQLEGGKLLALKSRWVEAVLGTA